MKRRNLMFTVLLAVLLVPAYVKASVVEFELLTHSDNGQLLAQQKDQGGDHLLQTSDDVSGGTYNPTGCFSFNFMNPAGIAEPGYAEGIHSMTGAVTLQVDLQAGGPVDLVSLCFDGYIAPSKSSAQHLVQPGDPAADGNHGSVNGQPNSGSYTPSAASNWAFEASFDWYYDTPFAGSHTIDMTFDNYQWNGFIVPVSELTATGMGAATLDDPLGYFGGTSADFESYLLEELTPRLPQDAGWLLFAQGEAQVGWSHCPGMTVDGLVGQTIVGYAVPEPTTAMFFLAWLCLSVAKRPQKYALMRL